MYPQTIIIGFLYLCNQWIKFNPRIQVWGPLKINKEGVAIIQSRIINCINNDDYIRTLLCLARVKY